MKKTFKNYIILFLTFFKIGLFTFGGGYAMIALIQDEIATRKKWIDDNELLDMIAVSESTPGPIAINMATYIGYKTLGVLGSFLATLGVVLPSFIIIFVISLFLNQFLQFEIVQHAFNGIKCAVAILIMMAGLRLLKKMSKKIVPILTFIICFAAMLLITLYAVNFSSIYLILFGAVVGLIMSFIPTKKEEK